MIPLRDTNRSRTTPFVTVGLVVVNLALFLYELSLGPRLGEFLQQVGAVPVDIIGSLREGRFEGLIPLVTSMFVHGGWLHVLGNMMFLWIFGDNVEDRFGHVRYLLFYLAGGIIASVSHLVSSPASTAPTIGASGAVAAVLGAYWYLYPRARVLTLIPAGFFITTTELPARLYLGIWFGIQFLSAAITSASDRSSGAGGVAWWAHIGGFLFGYLVAVAFYRSSRRELAAW